MEIRKILYRPFTTRNQGQAEKTNAENQKRTDFYNSFFSLHAEPFGVTVDARKFYDLGFAVNGIEDPQKYITGQITPLFDILASELESGHIDNISTVGVQMLVVENELKDINKRLDPAEENGYLKTINAEIIDSKKNSLDLENLAYPEMELYKMLKKTVDGEEQNDKSDQKNTEDHLNALQEALTRKKVNKNAAERFSLLKQFFDSTALAKQRELFPPRIGYVVLFFLISLILLLAETGISSTIIHEYQNTRHGWSNNMFSYAYSVGMAAGFAMLFKILIHRTLFTTNKNHHWYFIAFLAITFGVLWALFAHDRKTQTNDVLKGLILAFFSILFAVSNAFAFLQGSNLHSLYLRLEGNQSMKILEAKREDYISKCEKIKSEKSAELEILKTQTQQFEEMAEHIRQRLGRLKGICTISFLKGADDRMAEITSNHGELKLALRKKMKDYLDN